MKILFSMDMKWIGIRKIEFEKNCKKVKDKEKIVVLQRMKKYDKIQKIEIV